jgi:hypothetical protein
MGELTAEMRIVDVGAAGWERGLPLSFSTLDN